MNLLPCVGHHLTLFVSDTLIESHESGNIKVTVGVIIEERRTTARGKKGSVIGGCYC